MFNKTFMNKPAAVKNQGSSLASSSLQFSCGLDGATCFYGAVTSLMFCRLGALADSRCDGVMKLAIYMYISISIFYFCLMYMYICGRALKDGTGVFFKT